MTTNVPVILKIWKIINCFWANYFMGYFEEASTFLTPQNISGEMANKVICPQKNNLPHFQNQRYIKGAQA